MVDFGNRVKTLRKKNTYTQAQLTERLGVIKSVISAYEIRVLYKCWQPDLKAGMKQKTNRIRRFEAPIFQNSPIGPPFFQCDFI